MGHTGICTSRAPGHTGICTRRAPLARAHLSGHIAALAATGLPILDITVYRGTCLEQEDKMSIVPMPLA